MLAQAIQGDVPARSQAERAYWMLAERIIRLDLPPGQLLLDKELTAELGIGRTPMREALQRLATEGLVVHFPHRGMVVSEISASSTRDIYEFRSLIDGEAARLAATRRSDDEVAEFTGLAKTLAEFAAGDSVDAYIRSDRAFYAALGRACRNAYLAETIPRIFNLHLRLWFFISQRRGDWHGLAAAHSAMAADMTDAIAREDAEGAGLAVRIYVAQRQKDMRNLM